MNWKYAFIFFVLFLTTRILLSYFICWLITPTTFIIGISAALIYGYIVRNRI